MTRAEMLDRLVWADANIVQARAALDAGDEWVASCWAAAGAANLRSIADAVPVPPERGGPV